MDIYNYYVFYPREQQNYYGVGHGYYPLMAVLELYGYVPPVSMHYGGYPPSIATYTPPIISSTKFEVPGAFGPTPGAPFGMYPIYGSLPFGAEHYYGSVLSDGSGPIRY